MKFTLFTLRKLVEHLTVFLNKGRGGSIDESKMIPINRTIPFDPVTFIGKGSSIVWQDERSLRLSKVDPTKIAFQTTLRSGENSIQGEENLKRLIASGAVLLDAKVFQTLWEDKTLIPKSYKQLNNGKITFIFFPGTILQNSNGYRLVLVFTEFH